MSKQSVILILVCDDEYCAKCGGTGDEEPEHDNISRWIGCDNCQEWYHRWCLPADSVAEADISLITSSLWECPSCK